MEKIKKILKPGSTGDDEVLYGEGSSSNPQNMGKVSGEGSHFGTSRDDRSKVHPATAIDNTGNDASSMTAVKGGRPGETQAATNYMPDSTGSRSQNQAAYDAADPRHGQTTSGVPGESKTTPIYEQFATRRGDESQPRSDYTGAGTTAAGGADVAGAGAYGATRGTDSSTSQTMPPQSSTATREPAQSSFGGAGAYGATHGADSSTSQTMPQTSAASEPAQSSIGGAGAYGATRGADNSTSQTMPQATTTIEDLPQASTGGTNYTGPVHDSAFLNQIDPRVKPVGENTPRDAKEQTVRESEPVGGTTVDTHKSPYIPDSGTALGRESASGTAGSGLGSHSTSSGAGMTSGITPQQTSYAAQSSTYDSPSNSRAAETAATGVAAATTAAGATRPTGYDAAPATDNTSAAYPATDSTASRSGAHTKPIGTAVSTDSSNMPGSFPDSSNPYSRQAVDSRVDPHKSTSGDSRHYGRDAALGGAAAGAAGTAAYASQGRHEHPTDSAVGNQPSGTPDQSMPSGPAGSGYDSSAGTGRHVAQESGLASSGGQPTAGQAMNTPSSQAIYGAPETSRAHDTHHGRDAALSAGAVGAGGAAAYGLGRDSDKGPTGREQAQLADRTGPGYDQVQTAREPQRDHGVGREAALGTGAAGAGSAAAMYGLKDSDLQQNQHQPQYQQAQTAREPQTEQRDHHYGRDAVVGAGAAGAAAYGVDHEAERKKLEKEQAERAMEGEKAQKEHSKELEKEHKKEEKEYKKELKAAEKEHDKEVTKAENESWKEQKKHDKAVAAEAKEHQKEQEKAEKERQKEMEKHEKEMQKEEDHEAKKKGGLLGFLHRDKSKKEGETEDDSHGRETAAVGATGAGAAGVGAYEHHQHSGERNRLHKDPPDSVKYAEAPQKGYASQVTGGTGTTALAQGDNLPGGSHATGAGNKLDPAVADRGFAGQEQEMSSRYNDTATGGTGTTRLAQGENVSSGSHMTAAGNKLDPASSGHGAVGGNQSGQRGSMITDERTGLPIDLSKGEHRGLGTDHLPAGERS